MNKILRELLINSNVYSIEISGILSFKFSIDMDSKYSEKYDDIIIDFISGVILKDLKKNETIGREEVFNFIGKNVSSCFLLKNNVIELVLDNQYSIQSKIDDLELLDRQWELRDSEDRLSIINDGYQMVMFQS